MDNHPIPQDVTSFQFRLIGDMTLKQFGYVIAGVLCGWIMLASPLFLLLKIPLAGGCVLIGVLLAFVPIEGRPSDVMVLHFIHALFNPTQFVYQKLTVSQTPQQPQVTTTTPSAPQSPGPKTSQPVTEKVQIDSSVPIATAAIEHTKKQEEPVKPPQPAQAQETSVPQKQKDLLQNEVTELTQALKEAKAQEQKEKDSQAASVAHEKVSDLEKELVTITQQKQELEKQLLALQKTLAQKQQVFTPGTATVPQETQRVKQIPKQIQTRVGVPLVPEIPNLVTGVIKDPRGNILANMLIEVKDKDGNPVRAFKTNQLGQFASATPLVNGTYTISFEDPAGKQTFDSIEITANGEILLPLEIISVDAREKLRQELFGAKST